MSNINGVHLTPKELEDRAALTKAFKRLSHSNNTVQVGHITYRPERFVGQMLNDGEILGFVNVFTDRDGIRKVSIHTKPGGEDKGSIIMLAAKDLNLPKVFQDEFMTVDFVAQGFLDENGEYQVVPVARRISPPNFHQVSARSILNMTTLDENGKIVMLDGQRLKEEILENLRRNNIAHFSRIQIAGIVTGVEMRNLDQSEVSEDGGKRVPYIVIYLRQDGNKENVIPLRLIGTNLERSFHMLQGAKMATMTFRGALRYQRNPVWETDEEGNTVTDEAGKPVQKTDAEGKPVYRYNSFIKLTAAPANATAADIQFLSGEIPPPLWLGTMIAEYKEEMEAEEERKEKRRLAKKQESSKTPVAPATPNGETGGGNADSQDF